MSETLDLPSVAATFPGERNMLRWLPQWTEVIKLLLGTQVSTQERVQKSRTGCEITKIRFLTLDGAPLATIEHRIDTPNPHDHGYALSIRYPSGASLLDGSTWASSYAPMTFSGNVSADLIKRVRDACAQVFPAAPAVAAPAVAAPAVAPSASPTPSQSTTEWEDFD